MIPSLSGMYFNNNINQQLYCMHFLKKSKMIVHISRNKIFGLLCS